MPELPEVETTVRFLRPKVLGRRIARVEVQWPRMVQPRGLDQAARGYQVVKVSRRGKYLVFDLKGPAPSGPQRPRPGRSRALHYLIMHLRMSGSLEVHNASVPRAPHDRVVFSFHDGTELRFNDPRKFGRVHLVRDSSEVVGKLGVEPLERGFTWQALEQICAQHRGAIKPLLLNQTAIAGIGNIYCDESLWRAKIHPLRAASSLKENEIKGLHRAIRAVLTEGIETKGTDNGDGVVTFGGYRPRVYGREARPCRRCFTPITRTVVGQRGTHYCPCCQRKRRS